MRLRIRPRLPAAVVAAIATASIAAAIPFATASPQAQSPRTVLTIHWGAEHFPGTGEMDAAIREALKSLADAPVNYFAEYLESEAFPSSTLALRDYIARKYEGRRIDAVVATTTPALQFAISHRGELFPGVPIVFLAGSIPDEVVNHTQAGITGIVSDVSFAETLDLALTLHPDVRRVYVVASAPTEAEYHDRVRAALGRFSGRVEVTYLTETSVTSLLAAIRSIPRQSLIFYTRYTPVDGDSVADTVEVARLMAQVSPVPIYGPSALYLGTGVVGGMMRDGRQTGGRLGQMARKILDGARPEDIPIEKVQRVPTFDWRQVQRWRIDASRIPRWARVEFRTPTTWETYGAMIVGTLIVVSVQMLLIAGLLTQRARRRGAEETVRKREATLRSSYERIRQLAGRLIHAQEAVRAGIAQDLHDDMCQRLVYISMTLDGLKNLNGQLHGEEARQAFSDIERETTEIFDGIRRISHDLHPATLRVLGLRPALSAHCAEVEKRHGVRVIFETEGDLGPIHPDVAVCFFRIAQESIRNGIVHGHARRFSVSLARRGEQVELTVTDDGRGFDLDAVRRSGSGLGLVSMEERTHLIGGGLDIISGLEQGTTIRVRAPGNKPENLAVEPTEMRPRNPLPVNDDLLHAEKPSDIQSHGINALGEHRVRL